MQFSAGSRNVPLPQFSWDELKAGGKACRQLARAVAAADVERTGTLPRAERLAAARALSQIHQLSKSGGVTVMHMSSRPEELYDAVPAVVKVFSISLREVAALASSPPAPNESSESRGRQETSSLNAGGASGAFAAARSGGRPAKGGFGTEPGARAASTAAGSGHKFVSSADWVPLLVDSSAILSECLYNVNSGSVAQDIQEYFRGDPAARTMADTLSAAASDPVMVTMFNCAVAIASALLHSDALPALSRLLSAEAQRGPARALLSPGQLATCLQLLDRLILAAAKAPTALLPSIPPASRASAPTAAGAGPSATPTSTASSSTRPPTSTSTRSPSSATASPSQVPAADLCTSSTPRIHQRQRLGAAVLVGVAESGVLEAACRAVVEVLSGMQQEQQQQQDARWPVGHYSAAYKGLFEMLHQVLGAAEKNEAAVGAERLPDGLMGRILGGPCVQYALAAHSVSQLHPVDGGTTYGLPYDSMLPLTALERGHQLSCFGMSVAACWWMRMCNFGGIPPLCPLSPRNLFELCLRTAEVTADCWRRRNGLLPAAAAAAGGSSGSSHTRRHGSTSTSTSASTSTSTSGRPDVASRDHAGHTFGAGVPVSRVLLDTSCCATVSLTAIGCSGDIMCSCAGGRWGSPASGNRADEGSAPEGGAAAADGASSSGCGSGGGTERPGRSGSMGPASWLGDGGPLARRWWRAAVAAVHCALDEPGDLTNHCHTASNVLDLSSYMEEWGVGPAVTPAPPPALSAALDAGYLPCLERTLRCSSRYFHSMGPCAAMELLLPFGDEKEAAALIVTITKLMRAFVSRPPEIQAARSAIVQGFCTLAVGVVRGADAAVREARPGEGSGSTNLGETEPWVSATSSTSTSSSSATGGGSTGTMEDTDSLPLPVQQYLRLASFGLTLWLPLLLQLPPLVDAWRLQCGTWRWHELLDLLLYAVYLARTAFKQGDVGAAESWRGLLGSGSEVKDLISCLKARLVEEAIMQLAQLGVRPDGQMDAALQQGLAHIDRFKRILSVLDAELQQAQVFAVEGFEGIEQMWPLLGLLAPPCEARQVLACCSNPRCAELAGDSEAGVVLRRCGGACGGAAAYCCAACQKAHWAAGHREECAGKGRGGKRAGAGAGAGAP